MRPLPKELNAESARQFNLREVLRYRETLEANVKLFEEHLESERLKLKACKDAIEVLEGE